MSDRKVKLWTGTTLSILVCVLSVYPAVADSSVQPAEGQLISKKETGETIEGKIIGIRNDRVTVELSNGERKVFTILKLDRERLRIMPGQYITGTLGAGGTSLIQVSLVASGMNGSSSSQSNTATSRSATTTTTTTSRSATATAPSRSTTATATTSRATTTTATTTGNTTASGTTSTTATGIPTRSTTTTTTTTATSTPPPPTTTTPTPPTPIAVNPPDIQQMTGEIDSCDGSTLRLVMPDGTMRTYTVTMQQCNAVRPGQTVMIRTENGVVSQVQPAVSALW